MELPFPTEMLDLFPYHDVFRMHLKPFIMNEFHLHDPSRDRRQMYFYFRLQNKVDVRKS